VPRFRRLFFFGMILALLGAGNLALGATPAATPAPTPAAPRVVATIPPLHSLVAGVMQGIAVPDLLIAGGASPHNYSLRPSDARKLEQADLVVWIGPGMEVFLTEALPAIAAKAEILTVAEIPDVTLLPLRAGGLWSPHQDHDHDHAHDHEQVAGRPSDADMHLWLDPANARAIVAAVAQRLSEIDPARRDLYGANAQRLDGDLVTLDRELAARLAAVRTHPFVVFHDAFQYFERAYGLKGVGSVTLHPERPPGARRIAEIRDLLHARGADCVLREPQFKPDLIDTLIAGSEVNSGVLDPLGAEVTPGAEAYGTLMRGLAETLAACLEGSS